MPEHDIFRDTWVRYLGYANEVGESFRGVVPKNVVTWSYKVAFGYVLADTATKTFKMMKNDGRLNQVLKTGGDALIWQTLASVVIPGLTINRICNYSNRTLSRTFPSLSCKTRSSLVVALGLISIPIIIRPIDHVVTVFMNHTYRKFF